MTLSKISILLPTRGRTVALKASLVGLMEKCNQPEHMEILLGLDDDDQETLEYVKSDLVPLFQQYRVQVRVSTFKPLGYKNLHIYVNTLAQASQGDWLFFWNDDALMVSDGWDDIIREHDGEFKLLGPTDNHDGHPNAIFPIVPRDWFILLEHLSQNAQNDTWLSHIAYMLDIFERIPLNVIHDRADITGNNNDDTFKARQYMEGNPDDPEDFNHVAMKNARVASANKIAWFLRKLGKDMSWWEGVLAGKQNPFEKMVMGKNIKGAGMLSAVSASKQYPDDHILEL